MNIDMGTLENDEDASKIQAERAWLKENSSMLLLVVEEIMSPNCAESARYIHAVGPTTSPRAIYDHTVPQLWLHNLMFHKSFCSCNGSYVYLMGRHGLMADSGPYIVTIGSLISMYLTIVTDPEGKKWLEGWSMHFEQRTH